MTRTLINNHLHTATSDDDDFDDLLPTPEPYALTKAQAVRLLDRLYLNYITTNGLPDQAPDFRTLIDENVRSVHPPSAVKAGIKRGNRAKYGLIPHYRQQRGKNARLFFREPDLIDWFNLHFAPKLTAKAA
jgi:hypothetical protein